MEWKKWNGEDVGDRYDPVQLCLIAHYEGADYYWIFTYARCKNGEWHIFNKSNREGTYLSLISVLGGSRSERVKAYDPSRGDEIFYTTFETPDGHKFSPRFFKKAKAEGGMLMSVYEGIWQRAD